MFGGAIVTEQIFRVPGIGSLLISAILANDTPVIMGVTFVLSCLVIAFNLLADIRERTQVAYVVISHDLAVIRQITDDTIVMHRGVIVERGQTARVLDAPTSDYTRLLRNSVPRPGWKPGSSPSREPLQSVQPIFEFEESQS